MRCLRAFKLTMIEEGSILDNLIHDTILSVVTDDNNKINILVFFHMVCISRLGGEGKDKNKEG
ncbi:hypothetical protein KY289_002488 [Solanum tuberosum]|nr:hypothetical protein KY289_002488 [Solanum tuberosum]